MVMWIGEVVDYVPDLLPYGHVEGYRRCGLCTRHYHMVMWVEVGTEVVGTEVVLCTRLVTIWSCGGVQTLWIMYQTYYHMVMWNGTDVVDYVPDITIWSCGVVQKL